MFPDKFHFRLIRAAIQCGLLQQAIVQLLTLSAQLGFETTNLILLFLNSKHFQVSRSVRLFVCWSECECFVAPL